MRLVKRRLSNAVANQSLAPCIHQRFRSVAWVCWLLACWVASAATAVEPDHVAPQPAPPTERFEGLGFSVAPKEGGKARTRFFGLVGEGYKFVYVFDRSGSMGGSERTALRAVKAELSASLKSLDTVHQFQVIFYNERPVLFTPAATPGRLAFATEQNKQQVLTFLDSIPADGGTDHEAALKFAIHLRPDVIFFLTDADDPKLTPRQLAKIRDMAAGITIHTIQFGDGPQPAGGNFLIDLAHQNGGQHAYLDISKRRGAADDLAR
jgi:hypothetical protein